MCEYTCIHVSTVSLVRHWAHMYESVTKVARIVTHINEFLSDTVLTCMNQSQCLSVDMRESAYLNSVHKCAIYADLPVQVAGPFLQKSH